MARVGLLLYHPNINSLDWFTTSNPHLGVHNDFKYYHEVLHSNQCFVRVTEHYLEGLCLGKDHACIIAKRHFPYR
jgi:hypothetical protein